ncbi:MAG: DUF547 domain-containing protein [Desulfobacterales bacterium]|jgi:hypothetical protein
MIQRYLGLVSHIILSVVIITMGLATTSHASTVNHDIWAELLAKYIKPGGVDYTGFKTEENRLDQYLEVLENTDPDKLPRNEQYAYYINAYNAWTIKLILSGYPGVKSIKDFGSILQSPWQKEWVRINGEVITLDHVEHDILRPRYKDPRVHFAINCAAASCPPLRPEPYLTDTLDQQLDDSTRSFINDANSTKLEGNTLYVSRIFKWFSEDFNEDALGFYLQYAEGNLKQKLIKQKDDIEVKYLHYDWSLNDVKSQKMLE